MKAMNPKPRRWLLLSVVVLQFGVPAFSQTCPVAATITISTFPNTYYPATQASAPSGSNTITLGPAGYGTAQINSGDVLLIIQMQGAYFTSVNSSYYGDSTGIGNGYRNDANLLAGNMEFVVASNSVPTSGGTLTLKSNLTNSYKNQAYSSSGNTGQYTYQVVRVPLYYDLRLGATINVPTWNGSTGGVLVLAATDYLYFNMQTINGVGAGFRGGASRMLSGGAGSGTDYLSLSTVNANGGKGEGLAGTPRFINNGGTLLDNGSANEGYPNGAEARGAPGNAGGGGTDYDPSNNDQNSGGGGGGNGGAGGIGGNSWSSNQAVGGILGAEFLQHGPKRLVMGGGGGGGTTNNGTGGNNGIYSSGVAGGGIVIIYAGAISGSSKGTINVNGASGYTNVQNDGSGGGGAGGSVLIFTANAASDLSQLTVTANGGNGGSNSGNGAMHGPGGGGGGGVIYSNRTIGSTSINAGFSGTTANSSSYGSRDGSVGKTIQNISSSSVSPFPVSCTLLPVNFLSFGAQLSNDKVALNWVVESQTAVNYDVERSFDGSSFNAIGSLPADAKNNVSNSYSYIDNDATSPTGTFYYRIVEKDLTGQDFYSTVVVVKTASPAAASGVYPNPARESFTLTFNATAAGTVSLRLFDLSGRLMLTQPIQASTGVNAVTVNGLGTLPEGMYILQWFDGLRPYTSKVLIRH